MKWQKYSKYSVGYSSYTTHTGGRVAVNNGGYCVNTDCGEEEFQTRVATRIPPANTGDATSDTGYMAHCTVRSHRLSTLHTKEKNY